MKTRKVNGKNERYEMIIARRCDVPMAEKKHLLPCRGEEKCLTCYACMELTDSYEWRHCDPLRGKYRYQPEAHW